MIVMAIRRKWWRRFIVLMLLLVAASSFMAPGMLRNVQAEENTVYVDAVNGHDENDGSIDSPFATIGKALTEVADEGSIILLSDVTLNAQLTINDLKSVTIQSEENELHAIIRGANYRDRLIQVSNSETLVFKNLIIDGNNVQAKSEGVYNISSKTIFENVEIRNHYIATDAGAGAAVIMSYGNGSTVTIRGDQTKIHRNTIAYRNESNPASILGAGTQGVLEIKDGLITDNEVTGNSNGVIVGVGLYQSPRFRMTGGSITGNRLYGNEYNANGETVGNVAVYMRGTAAQARFEFSGTPYVYDNLNAEGVQHNVFLKNAAARDNAYLSIIDAMEEGAKVGVYANIMPTVENPIVDLAIGYGGYEITEDDAEYFESDLETTASVGYDNHNGKKKVVLIPVPRLESAWLDKTVVDGKDITFIFSDPIVLENLDGFYFEVGGQAAVPVSFEVDADDNRKLKVTLADIPTASVVVEYTKDNGNLKGASGVAVKDFAFTYDISFADDFSITAPIDDPARVEEPKPELQGTAQTDSTVTVVVKDQDGNVVASAGGDADVDENGNWSFKPSADLEAGTYTFEVTATSPDGKMSVTKIKEIEVLALVDKTALQNKVNEINGEGLEDADYTPESWQVLEDALEAAEAVLADADATQEEVDDALADLTDARDGLVPVVDKTALQNKVNEINGEGLEDADYTPESWQVLEDALEAAEAVLADADATQEEVDDALADLTDARDGLVPVVDKTALQNKVNEINGEGLEDADYTPESWQVLEDALEAAEAVLADADATQEEVDNALADLQAARAALVLQSSGSGGSGGGSSGSGSSGNTEIIEVDVLIGGNDAADITKVPIERTTHPDGTIADKVTFTESKAQETVDRAIESGKQVARVVIPDEEDKVDEVNVDIPAQTVELFQNSGIDLEIYTENALIWLPNSSLTGIEEDFYFRLVPIKDRTEREEIEERAQTELVVRAVAGSNEIEVVARPMTIETNLSSRPVTLILPLRDVAMPEDEVERTAFLKRLGIFIEHSDGEKEVVKGEVVTYDGNLLGLQFTILKFSTFTIIDFHNDEPASFHAAYMRGYPDGTFGPENHLTRAEMAAILSRILEIPDTGSAVRYPDVAPGHWAEKAIAQVSQAGFMIGIPDGMFKPEKTITRSEMAAIISRLKALSGQSANDFRDAQVHWAAAVIAQVYSAGYMFGYLDGTFRPDQPITRAEAVAVINRVLERGPLHGLRSPSWPDVPVDHWAFHEIEEASQDHHYRVDESGREQIEE